MLQPVTTDIEALKILDDRLRWLSAWTIHHANHVRENEDGLKVGGHQASCASMTAIMTALYFHALGPNDRVVVKPHAGPVLHAIHYLLGSQSREALENFRGFGGAQSYPSRTKDQIPVDFSTGSVGLGVAITLFASLVQDYLTAHGRMNANDRGRFVALIGDAELDEGNIYEALIEGAKHDVRNLWWIVDYNRQSLDATSADRMFERFDDDQPTLFIAYTIKGFGLPFAGHKDNHAGLMNPTQMAALRESMGIAEGEEWEPLGGVGGNARGAVEAVLDRARIAREKRAR